MATIFDILLNQHLNNYNSNKSSSPQQDQVKSVIINFVPDLDVVETKESFIIETELPGVNKEDIQIEIKDSKLYIQGEKKKSTYKDNTTTFNPQLTQSSTSIDQPSIEEFEDNIKSTTTAASAITIDSNKSQQPSSVHQDKVNQYISERSYGNFKRYLDLNRVIYTLDLSTIKTQFINGLLTITINKKQDHTNSIKITL